MNHPLIYHCLIYVMYIRQCFNFVMDKMRQPAHRVFLEHWNSQKSLCNIQQRFSCLLDEWIEKICKNLSRWLFLKSTLSVLRCTWTGGINLKIFLGYHINYLSIWPLMCHPWFPTSTVIQVAETCSEICFDIWLLETCQLCLIFIRKA